MKVDHLTLEKIAHLSRIAIQENEKEQLLENLNQMVEWVGKLDQVDTNGVEPLIQMSKEVNVFRQDISQNTLSTQEALANAPQKDSNYFRVPKVLE